VKTQFIYPFIYEPTWMLIKGSSGNDVIMGTTVWPMCI